MPAPPQPWESGPSYPFRWSPQAVFRAAVNLYAPWPHVFTSADITAAARLARHVSRALRLVQELALRSGGSADLSSAQLSRALAGLALRTLVREYGFSEEGALDYLRSVAGGAARESAGGTVHVLVPDSVPGPESAPAQSLCRGTPRRRHAPRPSTAAQDGELRPRRTPARAADGNRAQPGSGQAALASSFPWAWSGRRTFSAPAHAITWSNRVCRFFSAAAVGMKVR